MSDADPSATCWICGDPANTREHRQAPRQQAIAMRPLERSLPFVESVEHRVCGKHAARHIEAGHDLAT